MTKESTKNEVDEQYVIKLATRIYTNSIKPNGMMTKKLIIKHLILMLSGDKPIPVSDGEAELDSQVWFKSKTGPAPVSVKGHIENIKARPDLYSIAVPTYKVIYD